MSCFADVTNDELENLLNNKDAKKLECLINHLSDCLMADIAFNQTRQIRSEQDGVPVRYYLGDAE